MRLLLFALLSVCAVGCVQPPAPSPAPSSPNFVAPNLGTDPDAYRKPPANDPCDGPNCPRRPWRR